MNLTRTACLLALLPIVAVAHQGADGVVKERMELMKEVGQATRHLGEMAKSGEIRPEDASEAADRLRAAAEKIPVVFKDRNLDAPSEALPEIWEDWSHFTDIAAQMAEAAATFRDPPDDAAAFRGAVAKLGESCASCHERYRIAQQ